MFNRPNVNKQYYYTFINENSDNNEYGRVSIHINHNNNICINWLNGVRVELQSQQVLEIAKLLEHFAESSGQQLDDDSVYELLEGYFGVTN